MPRVRIDAEFLARVCPPGVDRDAFAAWVADLAAAPANQALVVAKAPDVLGIVETFTTRPTLGSEFVASGCFLSKDWRLVQDGEAWARAIGAKAFLYPVRASNPKAEKISRVLEGREGFRLWQLLYRKEL